MTWLSPRLPGFATGCSEFDAIFGGIGHVGFLRIPSQVFEGVVLGVIILVASDQAWWAWSDVGMKDQAMDEVVFPSKADGEVSAA